MTLSNSNLVDAAKMSDGKKKNKFIKKAAAAVKPKAKKKPMVDRMAAMYGKKGK